MHNVCITFTSGIHTTAELLRVLEKLLGLFYCECRKTEAFGNNGFVMVLKLDDESDIHIWTGKKLLCTKTYHIL